MRDAGSTETQDEDFDFDPGQIWDANEAAGLLHPFCYADIGEGCQGETVGFDPGHPGISENCVGCRGVRWLAARRAEATAGGA